MDENILPDQNSEKNQNRNDSNGAWRNYRHDPAGEPPRLRSYTAADFLSLKLPPRRMLLGPWLPEKGLVMIHAERGVGKTLLTMTAAYAIAVGGGFLGFIAPQPRKVIYIDGEMPANTMQERLAAIIEGFEQEPPSPDYFRILSGDMTDYGLPDLSTREGQEEINAQVGDADLIIVDNISTMVRSGKENEAESWLPIQGWALDHRRAGRSIIFIHHAGKSGQQRGTSRREDVLDTVIALRKPSDYSPDQGARFEVHYEKARGLFGKDAEPFEAQYMVADDAGQWTRKSLTDADLGRVVDVLSNGASIRDAADELSMHRSKVERLRKKALKKGMLGQ